MTETDVNTGARSRTRRAILAAAIDVLAQDGGASLAQVATAAEVSRTTVHRYFAERSDLVAAIATEIVEQVALATDRARLDHGPAPEALARLCREYFGFRSALTIAFNGTLAFSGEDWAEFEAASSHRLAPVVTRGHAEGTIAPQLAAAWIEQLMWALLYAAWEFERDHDISMPESLELCVRSLLRAIAP